MQEQHQKELIAVRETLADARAELHEATERCSSLDYMNGNLRKQVDYLNDLVGKLEEFSVEKEQMQASIRSMEAQLEELPQVKDERDRLQDELAAAQERVKSLLRAQDDQVSSERELIRLREKLRRLEEKTAQRDACADNANEREAMMMQRMEEALEQVKVLREDAKNHGPSNPTAFCSRLQKDLTAFCEQHPSGQQELLAIAIAAGVDWTAKAKLAERLRVNSNKATDGAGQPIGPEAEIEMLLVKVDQLTLRDAELRNRVEAKDKELGQQVVQIQEQQHQIDTLTAQLQEMREAAKAAGEAAPTMPGPQLLPAAVEEGGEEQAGVASQPQQQQDEEAEGEAEGEVDSSQGEDVGEDSESSSSSGSGGSGVGGDSEGSEASDAGEALLEGEDSEDVSGGGAVGATEPRTPSPAAAAGAGSTEGATPGSASQMPQPTARRSEQSYEIQEAPAMPSPQSPSPAASSQGSAAPGLVGGAGGNTAGGPEQPRAAGAAAKHSDAESPVAAGSAGGQRVLAEPAGSPGSSDAMRPGTAAAAESEPGGSALAPRPRTEGSPVLPQASREAGLQPDSSFAPAGADAEADSDERKAHGREAEVDQEMKNQLRKLLESEVGKEVTESELQAGMEMLLHALRNGITRQPGLSAQLIESATAIAAQHEGSEASLLPGAMQTALAAAGAAGARPAAGDGGAAAGRKAAEAAGGAGRGDEAQDEQPRGQSVSLQQHTGGFALPGSARPLSDGRKRPLGDVERGGVHEQGRDGVGGPGAQAEQHSSKKARQSARGDEASQASAEEAARKAEEMNKVIDSLLPTANNDLSDTQRRKLRQLLPDLGELVVGFKQLESSSRGRARSAAKRDPMGVGAQRDDGDWEQRAAKNLVQLAKQLRNKTSGLNQMLGQVGSWMDNSDEEMELLEKLLEAIAQDWQGGSGGERDEWAHEKAMARIAKSAAVMRAKAFEAHAIVRDVLNPSMSATQAELLAAGPRPSGSRAKPHITREARRMAMPGQSPSRPTVMKGRPDRGGAHRKPPLPQHISLTPSIQLPSHLRRTKSPPMRPGSRSRSRPHSRAGAARSQIGPRRLRSRSRSRGRQADRLTEARSAPTAGGTLPEEEVQQQQTPRLPPHAQLPSQENRAAHKQELTGLEVTASPRPGAPLPLRHPQPGPARAQDGATTGASGASASPRPPPARSDMQEELPGLRPAAVPGQLYDMGMDATTLVVQAAPRAQQHAAALEQGGQRRRQPQQAAAAEALQTAPSELRRLDAARGVQVPDLLVAVSPLRLPQLGQKQQRQHAPPAGGGAAAAALPAVPQAAGRGRARPAPRAVATAAASRPRRDLQLPGISGNTISQHVSPRDGGAAPPVVREKSAPSALR